MAENSGMLTLLSKKRKSTVVHLKTIDSTNIYLRSLAQQGAVHGFTVIADMQTKGRGRFDRTFVSPQEKGIYLSYLMRTSAGIADVSTVTAYTAVAVRKAIKNVCGIAADIKWVNDLLANGKKLCGILCESSLNGQGSVDYVIIGIGVNVKADTDFPPELERIATTLEQVCGKTVSREKLAVQIIKQLDKMCKDYGKKNKQYLRCYKKACINIGKQTQVTVNGNTVCGICAGIDDNFKLLIKTPEGETFAVSSGEASIVKK